MFGQDLLYALEQTAITAYGFIGSGKPKDLDKAATDTLRCWLNRCERPMQVCLSEYVKDDSFGFPAGERLGTNKDSSHPYPLIIDPFCGSAIYSFRHKLNKNV